MALTNLRGVVDFTVVEDVDFLFRKATSGVSHAHLYVLFGFLGRERNAAAGWGELASIVGQRVYHEQREAFVGLHQRGDGQNFQPNSLLVEAEMPL